MTDQTTMTNALDIQVGGSYYKKLGMQQVVYASANFYDPCAASIVKYITRWRDKNGLQDLQKALHYAELRQVPEIAQYIPNRRGEPPMVDALTYVSLNNMPPVEGELIVWLQYWVYSEKGDTRGRDHVVRLLQQLISENGG